jgi:hypothetical protein
VVNLKKGKRGGMAIDKKLSNDATSSIGGTIYQICVALERAFMLEEGQKLWIERFGDVTVSGHEQIEAKQYSDSLTDSHPNFWNTIKNWLLPGFDHKKYSHLTLFTTQSIGENSKLLEWNDAIPSKRFEILQAILNESEGRYQKSQESKTDEKKTSPPQSLLDQRFVLDHAQCAKLTEIIPKISIASDSPRLVELRKKIIDRHGKTILQAKRDEFLDDLMGYMMSPCTVQNGWEISFSEFSAKLTMISNHYRRGTVKFPAKIIIPSAEDLELQKEKRFVKKIHEIQYPDVVSDAIRHYISASITVIEEFQNYEVDPKSYQTYQSNLKQSQQTKQRLAKRRLSGDPITESKNFYDELTSETPQPFPSFEQTPIEFRNGVLHMLADDGACH